MNEKEVKLNQAAVDIIANNTLSEMLPREQQAYALMVALELAKSEAARQYHSPSKQEGTEAVEFAEWLSKNEWTKRTATHPKNVGKYWSHIHCEYKTIEQLYEIFKTQNP